MTTQPAESRVAGSNQAHFSVSDSLILVAALAAGFAMTRSLPDYLEWFDDIQIFKTITINASGTNSSSSGLSFRVRQTYHRRPGGAPSPRLASYWLGHVPYWAGPCLGSLTVASTALAFRGPRPRLSRLARDPGLSVGLALILALTIKVWQCVQHATSYKSAFSTLGDRWEEYWAFVGISLPPLVGYTMAALWLALAMSGRWTARRNPGARFCRVLGWCWIGTALIGELGVLCCNLGY